MFFPFFRKTHPQKTLKHQERFRTRKGSIISLLLQIFQRMDVPASGRTSSCLLSRKKASLSMEAALVMPLFLFAMLNLISLMELYEKQLEMSFHMYHAIRVEASVGVLLSETKKDFDTNITNVKIYEGAPAIGIMGFEPLRLCTVFTAKPWTGYYISHEPADEEETVWVTPNGEAYHCSSSCTYLKLSLRAVKSKNLEQERNLNGEIYKACTKCGGETKKTVFVTNYGTLYHTTLECKKLKRTVREIPISQVGERHACQKCYEE